MKITVLLENTTNRPGMLTEHGLSLYIETKRHKILFDTGQSDLFAKNAKKLAINLGEVDIAVLSHGHYDHGGGLLRFMEINGHAPIYMSQYAFEPHYSGQEKCIGIDKKIANAKHRNSLVGEKFKIDEELTLYSCNEHSNKYLIDNFGLNMIENGQIIPEDFRHEQYLEICGQPKPHSRVLISGCSHKGILNIMDWFVPDVLVGGFHFMKLDPDGDGKAALANAADILNTYGTVYYTGHCTGISQFEFLKRRMGEKLNYMSTGMILEM